MGKTKFIGIFRHALETAYPFEWGSVNPFVWFIENGYAKILWHNGCVQNGKIPASFLESRIKDGTYAYLDTRIFNAFFPKNQIKEISMSAPLNIRKSALYFNTTTNQVERVLTIQDGSLVWTSRHKQEAKPYPKSAFRLANQVEVDNYLNEAKAQVS